MTAFVALLRAVNVGGTGKLAMSDLKALCETAGFQDVGTYIASGNVVFASKLSEAKVKAELETRLAVLAGKPVDVMVRTAAQMAAVRDANPFPEAPGKQVMAIFLDDPAPKDTADKATGLAHERISLGVREIYVDYVGGMGASKLRIPAARAGTARNMNTVAKLAEMAAELA